VSREVKFEDRLKDRDDLAVVLAEIGMPGACEGWR
jgi:hypothetical protein